MTNPVPGLCPCCKNPKNSVFMQSIHSDGLFQMLLKRGEFKRNYLFCSKCIDWAKAEVFRLRERQPPPSSSNPQYSPISEAEAGASRSTPDPFNDVDPMNDNDPMMNNVIAQRLANPTDSPIHLGNPMSPVTYIPYDERSSDSILFRNTSHIIAPLPSPLNDQWDMEDDQKSNDKKDHINL